MLDADMLRWQFSTNNIQPDQQEEMLRIIQQILNRPITTDGSIAGNKMCLQELPMIQLLEEGKDKQQHLRTKIVTKKMENAES